MLIWGFWIWFQTIPLWIQTIRLWIWTNCLWIRTTCMWIRIIRLWIRTLCLCNCISGSNSILRIIAEAGLWLHSTQRLRPCHQS